MREWDLKHARGGDGLRRASAASRCPTTKATPYSIDDNLWGRAIECGVLEDPWVEPPADIYTLTSDARGDTCDERRVRRDQLRAGPAGRARRRALQLPRDHQRDERPRRQARLRPDRHDREPARRREEPRDLRGARARSRSSRRTRRSRTCASSARCCTTSSASSRSGPSSSTTACGSRRSRRRSTASSTTTQKLVTGDVRLRFFKGSCVVVGRRSAVLALRLQPGDLRRGRHVRPHGGQGLHRPVGPAHEGLGAPAPQGRQGRRGVGCMLGVATIEIFSFVGIAACIFARSVVGVLIGYGLVRRTATTGRRAAPCRRRSAARREPMTDAKTPWGGRFEKARGRVPRRVRRLAAGRPAHVGRGHPRLDRARAHARAAGHHHRRRTPTRSRRASRRSTARSSAGDVRVRHRRRGHPHGDRARADRADRAAGARLHTARSRNDQVATRHAPVREARGRRPRVPGRTRAAARRSSRSPRSTSASSCPATRTCRRRSRCCFSHHLLAYAWMLARDVTRLRHAYEAADVLPLGSAALAGTTFPLDRDYVADATRLLGRQRRTRWTPCRDRDFLLDLIYACAVAMMHLSRLCRGARPVVERASSASSRWTTRSPPAARSCRRRRTPTSPSSCAARPAASSATSRRCSSR